MYLHFHKHINLAYYNQDLICLDLRKDQYLIFDSNAKKVIGYLLENPIHVQDGKYLPIYKIDLDAMTFNQIIQNLIKQKILRATLVEQKYSKAIYRKVSYGVKTEEWIAEHSHFAKKLAFFRLLAILFLMCSVRIWLKLFGIHRIIKTIRKRKPKKPINNHRVVSELIHELNTACLYFPANTKCLEWAITYMFLAYKLNIDCKLIIGVQTQPFVAHAWVEYNGVPFSDSSHIANEVVPILVEPR